MNVRSVMKRRFTLLALALAPAIAVPSSAGAAKLWERDWLEITTEHFVIASALSEERSVALARDLENFRYAARMIVLQGSTGAFEERIPTKVYVLAKPEPELGFDGNIAGLFMPGMRANYALILASGKQSDEVLKHEYVHFLIHNHSALLYPPWFDEGFAEVLSTLTAKDGVIEYGKSMQWRVDTLVYGPWMSFPKLLESRDPLSLGSNIVGSYYAQSWLLMHYLMIGRQGHKFSDEVADFLRRSENGEPALEAFEAAFGIDPRALEGTLLAYARNLRYFRTTGEFRLPPVDPQVRRLAADEIAADLGLLALVRGSYEASEEYYAAALEANPNNAIALAGMGDIHKHAKRFDEAERHYALAVAAEPTNGNHELDWGEYFLQRAEDEPDAERRHALLVEARRHFARSYSVNPENPETLHQNGLTYLFDDGDPAKAVASLEAAYDLLPSFPGIQAALAAAYMKSGRPQTARPLLSRVLAWSHDGNTDDIKKMLAELESAPQSAEPASAEPASVEQTSAEQTGAEQTGAEQTGAEQTGAEQTSAEQTGAEQTGAERNGAESTGTVPTGAPTRTEPTGVQ